ncbi:MAG TPA: hypothetical protein VF939_15345 [Puia sp.]
MPNNFLFEATGILQFFVRLVAIYLLTNAKKITMAIFNLLQTGLVLHITGIIMMVGVSLAEFVASRQLWMFILTDKDKARTILRTTSSFSLLQGIGAVLIIAGGILMMAAFHGAIAGQLWFQVKMVLLLLILLNFLVIARPAKRKLRKLLNGTTEAPAIGQEAIPAIKKRLTIFQATQLVLFWLIIVLAVFKFN